MESAHKVWCQKWLESERGWGTRPDGFSLHISKEDLAAFVREYWEKMPESVPDEYSRPDGEPYLCPVNARIYEKVSTSKNGIRGLGTAPYPGGIDGWVSCKPVRLDEEGADL